MTQQTDHGDEPATFPSIEVEKQLSRVQGLVSFLINNPEHTPTTARVLHDILQATNNTRDCFRDHLNNTREERMRLIRLAAGVDARA